MPATRAPRRHHKWLVLFGVGMALLAFELTLQGLAYITWASRPTASPLEPGAPVVLCIGDSFTYGMGASSPHHSYPDRLATHLTERLGRRVEVVNGGWASRTSRHALLELPGQLELYAPKLVCILIGINDLSFRVRRVRLDEETAEQHRGFPLRLRLAKLAGYVGQWLAGGPAYSQHQGAPMPFLGTWHRDGFEICIEADGRLITGGQRPMRWHLRGARLMLQFPNRPEFDSDFRIEDGNLSLQIPDLPNRMLLAPGTTEDSTPLARGKRALRQGQHVVAETLFREAIAAGPPAAADQARVGLVKCLVALDRHSEARQLAEQLAARARDGQEHTDEHALRALAALGDCDAMVTLTIELRDLGMAPPLWSLLNDISRQPDGHKMLQAVVRRALDNPAVTGKLRARLLRVRFLAMQESDPEQSLLSLIQAELIAGAEGYTITGLHHAQFTDAMFERCLANISMTETQRSHIRRLRSEQLEGSDQAAATLRFHLQRMIIRCRAAGATPVLLTYPFHAHGQVETVRQVAAETGVQLVSLVEGFQKLLRTHTWEDLFIIDGHCNDAGYDEMARLVAEALAPELR